LNRQGLEAYKQGNYKIAAEHFKKVCDRGFAGGCYNLGILYDMGKGVQQNYSKAAELYTKALQQNYSKAAELFKKACDGGIAKGCYNLSILYHNGQGVSMNKSKAFKYLMKAVKQGKQGNQ